MIIRDIEIVGLNNSKENINLTFNDDINIITGRNGSGKTTILKLIWYCISGNIERAVREITFSKVNINTSRFRLIIEKGESKNRELTHYILYDNKGSLLLEKKEPTIRTDGVDAVNHIAVELLDTSVFFPTFRRIEGGFSMTDSHRGASRRIIKDGEEFFVREQSGFGNEIQTALESHANRLSVFKHKFVSSISTADIKQLVVRKHNDATTLVDDYSKSLSENIFSEIRAYRETDSSETALRDAISTLDKINQDVIEFEQVRENAFKALNVLSNIIVTIFRHKGIRLNPRVALGDIDNSINSDFLSAGEKQMLSFLCYNAFYSECPFFIDEPELSLHVDWQRILLDVLTEQKTNNQLFIATHSPFIYTQYTDKEIMIGNDRGYSFE